MHGETNLRVRFSDCFRIRVLDQVVCAIFCLLNLSIFSAWLPIVLCDMLFFFLALLTTRYGQFS